MLEKLDPELSEAVTPRLQRKVPFGFDFDETGSPMESPQDSPHGKRGSPKSHPSLSPTLRPLQNRPGVPNLEVDGI